MASHNVQTSHGYLLDCIEQHNQGLKLLVRLTPKAGRDEISGEHAGRLKISVTSPPVDSKANKHLVKLLSKKLKIPKSGIVLVTGETSRDKTLQIKGLTIDQAIKGLGL